MVPTQSLMWLLLSFCSKKARVVYNKNVKDEVKQLNKLLQNKTIKYNSIIHLKAVCTYKCPDQQASIQLLSVKSMVLTILSLGKMFTIAPCFISSILGHPIMSNPATDFSQLISWLKLHWKSRFSKMYLAWCQSLNIDSVAHKQSLSWFYLAALLSNWTPVAAMDCLQEKRNNQQ